jgi:hypothetical protein
MKFLVPVLVATGLILLAPAAPAADQQCKTGPVTRTFGQVPWLVYSCEDKRSLLVVSAPGNPAMPAFFVMNPVGEGYDIRNQGSGNQAISTAAYHDLKKLSAKEIAELIAATQAQ